MLQKIKEQSNLEVKLGALKEMISEGWLTHIQQHPTFLKPNWPLRDQIASEDGIFTKPPNYHSYDSAEIYFRRTPQTTQSNKENQAKSENLCWRRLVPWHRRYHKSMQLLWGTPVQSTKGTPNPHRDTPRVWHTIEAALFTLDITLHPYALTPRTGIESWDT